MPQMMGKQVRLRVPEPTDQPCLIHHARLFLSVSSPDFVNGKHRTYQVKDDPPEACLIIPDGGRHKVTIFYYFPFIFPEPQQMVEDTIRALSQPWDLAFCMYHKHSQKSWSIRAFSMWLTCLKQEFVFSSQMCFSYMPCTDPTKFQCFCSICSVFAQPAKLCFYSLLLTVSIQPDRCRVTPRGHFGPYTVSVVITSGNSRH